MNVVLIEKDKNIKELEMVVEGLEIELKVMEDNINELKKEMEMGKR